MSQITPAPLNSPPDFVPADGLDETTARPRAGWLWLLLLIPLIYGLFTLGAWSNSRSPQPPSTGPYSNVSTTASGKSGANDATVPAASASKLIVHVVGAVQRPGVYELPANARVRDAIQKAGGPIQNADVNALNLAAWAEDGSRIEVPLKVTEPVNAPTQPLITLEPQPAPERIKPKTAPAKSFVQGKAQSAPTAAKPAKKSAKTPPRAININRASLDDLTLLPGVGPAIAQRIIDYRTENGPFGSIDELDEVKGIGEKKLEQMRPWVTL